MTGWVCQWKLFWIPVIDSFKKAFVKEWVFQVTDSSDLPFPEVRRMLFQRLLRCRCLSHRHHGKHRNPRIQLVLGNVLRHHCLHCCHDLHVIVWSSCDAMLSGYEYLHLPGSDQFTMWGKMTPDEIFTEHVVEIHRIEADFRDAFERNQASSSQTYGVNNYFSSQSLVQKTPSIYNWNPGPRRVGKVLSRNKLQESGTSLHCKKLLNKSNTKSFMHAFM